MASAEKKGLKIVKAIKMPLSHPKTSLSALAAALYLSSDAPNYPDKLRAKMMLENHKYQ